MIIHIFAFTSACLYRLQSLIRLNMTTIYIYLIILKDFTLLDFLV